MNVQYPVDAEGAPVLRRLETGDIEAVREIVAGAFNSPDLGEKVAVYFDDYCRSGLDRLTLDQQPHESVPVEYWVLTDTVSGEVIGLCGLYRFRWAWTQSLWLGWTAIAPYLQSRGVGAAMLMTLMRIARARGAEVFKVETPLGGRAVSFYKKLGFIEEGILSKHYDADMDALVLSRDMSDITPLPA
jgi:N-acetylglutamate synthase-like GNAT family acetyltransferase